ncbi:hypothetical protein [Vibrio vulnificus]|uniref:hypothetical protein n=1 Tax=Vibrio vulnificus TaxID=672 RepID=UPI001CDD85AD|nr:hypothetical protein [Vibrio vulnificus]
MKCPLVVLMSIFISGCATQSEVDQETVDFLVDKYNVNAPAVLCTQEGYTSCFEISTNQCLSSLSEKVNTDCRVSAEMRYDHVTSENFEPYVRYYNSCLKGHLLNQYEGKVEKLDKCISESHYDEDEAMKALLK